MSAIGPTLEVATAEEWRAWLAEHHASEREIWLVYYKQHTGRPSVDYGVSVEEALCFGWVDNQVRRIDDDRFARKFTHRKPKSKWSSSNKKRVEKLIREGRMTPFGQRRVDEAKSSGAWDAPDRPEIPGEPPTEFAQALGEHPQAKAFFDQLTAVQKRNYIAWITTAKRQATRDRRLARSIEMLERGEKLGMV